MNARISALVAIAFLASVGLTACGEDDDRDEVEIENGEGEDQDD